MNFKISTLVFAYIFLATKADRQLFKQFQVDHGKTYQSLKEKEYRYSVFMENLKEIDEHNTKFNAGLVTWELGVNQFADRTAEEFKSYLRTFPVANVTNENSILYKAPLDVSPPASIDWREKGAVTVVKNQGGCGSCWAFSATGTTEGQYFAKKGNLITLSEQQLLDCANKNSGYSCGGCKGGIVQSALDYVRDYGLETESSYPYKTKESGNCSAITPKIVVKTKGYVDITFKKEDDLKSAVGLQGPVSVAVNADLWQHYKSGIFDDTNCNESIDHGVVVVGYGTESGIDYWIIKNSWGTNFGEEGYIRMAMGHNLCGLTNQACYPYF